jgi:hypothetical protein
MSRRGWIILSLSLFLAIVVAWNLFVGVSRPRWVINRERFSRIERGMSRAQVQAILSVPPGDYTILKAKPIVIDVSWGVTPPTHTKEEWISDVGWICITWNADQVVDVTFEGPGSLDNRPPIQVLGRFFYRPQ